MASAAPHLSASAIASVPAGTFGPYLGMRGNGGLSVWASLSDDSRFWYARPLSERGEAAGDPLLLGEAPSELGLVSVRPLREGFALVSSHKTSDGEVVTLSLLSAKAALLAGPVSLGRSGKAVLWVEAIPSARGATVLWASSGSGRAEIWSVDVSPKAEPLAPARLVARDAGAWQAVSFGKGVALAVTRVGKGNAHGPIELSLLNGSDTSAPVVINSELSAELDLDMASLGERLVLAWSDHRRGETRVYTAAVDSNGKVVAPAAPATPPLGEQAVLRVVAPVEGSTRGYLAWEALDAQAATYRSFQVAEFLDNGRVKSPRGLFEYWKMDGSMPEIAATPNGVAVLTLAPVCEHDAPCTKTSPIAPEFVEFDAGFAVRSTEPLWSAQASAPSALAWNLTCPNATCFALTAQSSVPSPVALTRLEHLSDSFRAPAQRVELPPPPRIVGDEALAETAALAQLALSETSSGTLLGWLTDFDPTTPWVKLKKPTADGRFEPLRARLDLQGFAAGAPFTPLTAIENLSLRAHSLGGIALSGNSTKKETLAAWAGLDGGQPQVFLTMLDNSGKKLSQRMLTRKTGDLSDVALASAGADYLVAWIDERSGDPEVYAAKVNRMLNHLTPEQRITQAPGAATDLSLVATQSGALAVWADARDSERAGSADIYAVALRNDGSRAAAENALLRTRTHSFAPSTRAYGSGALVAWLEAASEHAESEPAHVNLAVLDESAHVVGDVQSVNLPGGTPVTLGLDCAQQACHIVVAVEASARADLYAIGFRDGKVQTPVRIRSTNGSPSSVAPLVHGTEVYIADAQQGGTRLRRLQLEW
ncbi:MAG TPA: hypothetical protein VFK05_00805 [Polyangiaceae bacterium]|nr:hypothetical protein [Polyangiaceae bacterium]